MPLPTQPDGPSIIYALFCEYCEFDTKGTEVSGTTGGDRHRKILDEQGWVKEEVSGDEKGVVTSRTVYTNGPMGRCEAKPT